MDPHEAPAPNCTWILDNGHPCQAPARRGQPFCRHHDPEALRLRRQAAASAHPSALPAPASPISVETDEPNPWMLRAYWRIHHRLIPTYGPEDLDAAFGMILEALADRQIAPRSAGKLILAILDRRCRLAEEARNTAMRVLAEQARRTAPSPASSSAPAALAPRAASGVSVEALG